MDSRIETYKHIQTVQKFLGKTIADLLRRLLAHDQSKLTAPEVEVFDEFTPKLANSTYGSEEYKEFLRSMKPALDHHYAVNSHHPEFYGYQECNGCFKRFPLNHEKPCDICGYTQTTIKPNIAGMSLLDLIEMLCDWRAATERHKDGDIRRSIEQNQKRFGYSDELKQILLNTLAVIEKEQ